MLVWPLLILVYKFFNAFSELALSLFPHTWFSFNYCIIYNFLASIFFQLQISRRLLFYYFVVFLSTCSILCYIIYFIYVPHVALSYFAAFLFLNITPRATIPSNKFNLILRMQNVYIWLSHMIASASISFEIPLPCLSLDLLPVSHTFAFYLLPRRKRDITFSLLPSSFGYWTASRIESFLPRQVDYTLEVAVTVFSRLASIPHGTKRWI